MKPREFAEALNRGEKFLDSESGEIISIYGGPDITGDVVGYTDDGRMIKANAKNLELANEKDPKSDSEKLEEMMTMMMGLSGGVTPKEMAEVSKSDEITTSQTEDAKGMDKIIEEIENNGVLSSETIEGMTDDQKKNLLEGYLSADNIDLRYHTEVIETRSKFIKRHTELKGRAIAEGKIELAKKIDREIVKLTAEVEESKEKIEQIQKKEKSGVTHEDITKMSVNNEMEEIMPVDESKFAQIYGKARGRIKQVYLKIKSFLNIKSNDKTNEENIK